MATISWLLSLLHLNRRPHPGQHFDFLALPGEVRNLIYDLTLTTDPPRLCRGHKESCKWCTLERGCAPEPNWANDDGRRLPGCRCWARSGVALLLANRQINKEASLIFWSQNHFSFSGVDSFTHLVGTALRPQYRQMIPHITIYLGPAGKRYMDLPPRRFWNVLFKCKRLRTLEIPPYQRRVLEHSESHLVDAASGSWWRMTRELPNLRTFSWSYFQDFLVMDHPLLGSAVEYPCRITKSFDLRILSPAQLRRSGPFTYEDTDFGWELCERALSCKSRTRTLVRKRRPVVYYCPAGAVGHRNTFDVTLPGAIPTSWTVKFFLLPFKGEVIFDSPLVNRI